MKYQSVPSHWNQPNASTTKFWHGSDTEDEYKKNCSDPERLRKLQQYGWYECSDLTYCFNSQGFRDDEFDQRPAVLAIGCSFTQGIGLKVDQCWPRQLENLLQKKVWNLGVGGTSLDTCYRLLEYWIAHLNVDSVFCAVPPISRYEVFINHWECFSPHNSLDQRPDWLKGYHKHYLAYDKNFELNRRKNIHAMQDICRQHNVSFYVDYLDNFKSDTDARDLLHQGPPAHVKLAQDFFKQIKGSQ
jgi:hypothetical protein